MKAKEVSSKTGLKERTIRFYEEQGLLHPTMERRNGRNYREYSQDDLHRLQLIATLRRANFTLEEIRQLLEAPETVETVYAVYLTRIRQTAADSALLLKAASEISPAGLTPSQLAQRLEQQVRNLSLPPADLEPHFGRADAESPEEKQAAITAYHARHMRRQFTPQTIAIALLCLLCLVLAAGWGLWGYSHRDIQTEPAPSGSVEGCIYYKSYENGVYSICRYEESTGSTQPIYESQELSLAFSVGPNKLYVNDGQGIYSLNFDGSGKYLLTKELCAVSGCMIVYEGYLYGIEPLVSFSPRSSGTLARIPLSGGSVESLNIGCTGTFDITGGILYSNFAGTLTTMDLSTMEATEYDLSEDAHSAASDHLDSVPELTVWNHGTAYGLDWWNVSQGQWGGTPVLTCYTPEADGSLSVAASISLPDHTMHGDIYVHNGLVYYYTIQGSSGNSLLWALDPSSGKSVQLTEQSISDYPAPGWGENGFILAAVPDTPLYIPYPSQ